MRKLAAIMFTDIVGYSALMSKDESLALEVLERNRLIRKTALQEHNGELIKEIGDGSLCIFRSSWDAVYCAISIQKMMAEEGSFRLRIGIHIGDIVFTDNDVFGDGVNIASRIESICEPGGICFTQRVYEDIQNKIDYRVSYAGEKSLKNIGHIVKAYTIAASEFLSNDSVHHPHRGPSGKETFISGSITSRFPKKSKAILITSGLLALLLAGFFMLRPLVLKALMSSEPIPIAVISFENQTGDQNFDYLQKAIPNLLITNLEQSNLFHVISWERMHDLLEQMGKNDITTIDPALGFEICKREGCNLIVIGSYVKAGDTFVTDVKILDVSTKKLIKSASARGTGEASILQSQIDYLSKEISGSAGIPYRRIENAGLHVIDVTTSSMAAYDLYLKGREALDKMYYNDAREFLEEALRLDSTFAVAWLLLSNANGSLENTQMRDYAIEKAYQYSSSATEKEQLQIKSAYAWIIDNDPGEELRLLKELAIKTPKEKRVFFAIGKWYCNNGGPDEAIANLNKALALDPDYSEALNQVAYQYMKKGMFMEALTCFRRYAALCPKDANPHDSMGDLLWQMGKLAEALKEYKQALEIKPDYHVSAGKIAYIYALQEDYKQAVRWIEKAIDIAPSPGTKAIWHWVNAWIYNWCGNIDQAHASLGMSQKLAVTQDNEYTVSGVNWLKAFIEKDLGRFDSAEVHYQKAFQIFLEISNDHSNDSAAYFLFTASIRLAQDNLEDAQWCLDNVSALIPKIGSGSVDFTRFWLECTKVEMLIAKKDFQTAVEQGKMIKPPLIPSFEFPQVLIYNIPFRHDYLAQAYANLGMTTDAIREYERLISFDPSGPDRRLAHPVFHYYLGKLYESTGQAEKAMAQYHTFLELWHDADPVFPEPPDAIERLKGLAKK